MATIDQLMAAFGAFGQAAKEYGVTKGIQDATTAVTELKKNTELDYQQRIAMQGQVANQLQAGLAGLGAGQAQIAAAVGAIAPPKINSAADALALANNSADPVEREALLKEANSRAKVEGQMQLEQAKPLTKFKTDEEIRLRTKQAEFDKDKALRAAAADVKLPDDVKQFVQKTGERVGTQVSIANELNTFIDQWETLSEDEKLQQGRELMKTLNSAQGADAVGAEEVKRLGAKLEFATGNVFSSNPLQLGRDLDGFYQDVINSQAKVAKTANANRDQMRQAIIQRSIPTVAVAKEKKASSGRTAVGATPKGSPPPIPQYSPEDLKAELARRRGE